MPRVLILAYGNPMRCDDGVAWHVADELERKLVGADVEILRRHQLTPELAETVSHSQAVIFVDAASPGECNGPGAVRFAQVEMPEGPPHFSHQFPAESVVALARQLYGASPRAFSVTLTGQNFGHGEGLSPVVAGAVPALLARIEALARSLLSPDSFSPGSH